VIHERIGRAALRAYPPPVRQARGPEMLGMLLDAGEHSRRAFVRESGSLVLGGLRERRAITVRAGARRLIADSCCQAVLIWLMLWILSALDTQLFAGLSRQLLVQEVVLAAILLCALVGYERIAAISGLAAIAVFGPIGPHTQLVLLARAVVPIGCLLVMVRAPRKRPRDPRRLLWLLPVCALAVIQPQPSVGLPEVLALLSLGGLLRLFHDPRLAIACGLVWIVILTADGDRPVHAGLGLLAVLAFTVTGVMLTVGAGRLWIMRRGQFSR